jgi:hypothetical protein
MKTGITHENGTSSSRSKPVVHKTTRPEGGQRGNRNAVKEFVLPEWLKLDSAECILQFMRTILIPNTLAGRIGTRAASAVNTSLKILLDYESLQDIEVRLSKLEEEKAKTN